jgi:hypothetical protein
VTFPSDASGAYAVVLTTQGTYAVSHGDLTHVTRTVNVTIAPATPQQELRAWLITLLYLLILAYLVLQLRCLLAPKPFGRLVSSDGSGGEEFARARRGLAGFFAPSAVSSSQMELEPGLIFGFHRRGRITVHGTRERGNYRLDGNRVPLQAVPATEATISLPQEKVTYTVVASSADDDEAEEQPSARREIWNRVRGRRADADNDDAYADDEPPRRGLAGLFAGRRGNTDDDDDDTYDTPRGRSRGVGRFEDDDAAGDAPARSRWGRSRRRADDDDEW